MRAMGRSITTPHWGIYRRIYLGRTMQGGLRDQTGTAYRIAAHQHAVYSKLDLQSVYILPLLTKVRFGAYVSLTSCFKGGLK